MAQFREQVGNVLAWFPNWRASERLVVLQALLQQIPPVQARYLVNVVNHNNAAVFPQLLQHEQLANSPDALLTLQVNDPMSVVRTTTQLLDLLPLVLPSNRTAALAMASLIEPVCAHTLRSMAAHQPQMERCRDLVTVALSHPAFVDCRPALMARQQQLAHASLSTAGVSAAASSSGGVTGALSSASTPPSRDTPPFASVGTTAPSASPSSSFSSSDTPLSLSSRQRATWGSPGDALRSSHDGWSTPPQPAPSNHNNALQHETFASMAAQAVLDASTPAAPAPAADTKRAPLLSSVAPPGASFRDGSWLTDDTPKSASTLSSRAIVPPPGFEKNRKQQQQQQQQQQNEQLRVTPLDSTPQIIEPPFNPHSGMKEVPTWLKSLRLHKYLSLFASLSYSDMLALTDDALVTLGVAAAGARKKMVLSLQRLRDRESILDSLLKDMNEPTKFASAVEELKLIASGPIVPNPGQSAGSFTFPQQFSLALARAFCVLALGTRPNETTLTALVSALDRVSRHSAFSLEHKRRFLYWLRECDALSLHWSSGGSQQPMSLAAVAAAAAASVGHSSHSGGGNIGSATRSADDVSSPPPVRRSSALIALSGGSTSFSARTSSTDIAPSRTSATPASSFSSSTAGASFATTASNAAHPASLIALVEADLALAPDHVPSALTAVRAATSNDDPLATCLAATDDACRFISLTEADIANVASSRQSFGP